MAKVLYFELDLIQLFLQAQVFKHFYVAISLLLQAYFSYSSVDTYFDKKTGKRVTQ